MAAETVQAVGDGLKRSKMNYAGEGIPREFTAVDRTGPLQE